MTLRLTRAQVREIDRRATADYGIPSIVLMENAARGAADVATEMLAGDLAASTVVVLCGSGNNGGDGFALARHLHNRGAWVVIAKAWDREPIGDAGINLGIVRAMKVPVCNLDDLPALAAVELVIDALYGTGLTRPLTGKAAEVAEMVAPFSDRTLAIDLPSGLDCDTGLSLGPCVRATRTVTFVAEKAGFANPASKAFTGDITVADIGVPRELIDAVAASA